MKNQREEQTVTVEGKGDSDEDDYETRKESHSRHVKKKTEDDTLDKLNNRSQEGEYLERREGSRDRGHGSSEKERNSRRRWNDSDASWRDEDSTYVDKSDVRSGRLIESKIDSCRVKSDGLKIDQTEIRTGEAVSDGDKLTKSQEWEEKRSEPGRSKDKFDFLEEESKGTSLTRSTKETVDEDGSAGIKHKIKHLEAGFLLGQVAKLHPGESKMITPRTLLTLVCVRRISSESWSSPA